MENSLLEADVLREELRNRDDLIFSILEVFLISQNEVGAGDEHELDPLFEIPQFQRWWEVHGAAYEARKLEKAKSAAARLEAAQKELQKLHAEIRSLESTVKSADRAMPKSSSGRLKEREGLKPFAGQKGDKIKYLNQFNEWISGRIESIKPTKGIFPCDLGYRIKVLEEGMKDRVVDVFDQRHIRFNKAYLARILKHGRKKKQKR